MAKFREIFRGKSRYVTVRPGAEEETQKREVPDGLWTKCPECRAMIYNKDLERNLHVCDKCSYHFPVGVSTRLAQLLDDTDSFVELDANLVAGDPLAFPDYPNKLQVAQEKTGQTDAVVTGVGHIGGVETVVCVMNFFFMGGSMGSVVGERITRAFEWAGEKGLPIVTVSASGGARMQEGIFSLMQMEKTVAAVERFSRTGNLFISVLTHPTTAGVFGSFASLGDIILAEPGATVGFAGQRVIEETIRKAVPPNLQKAETVFENGFIDRVVSRSDLADELARLLLWHTCTEPITIGSGSARADEGEEIGEPVDDTPIEDTAVEETSTHEEPIDTELNDEAPKNDAAKDEPSPHRGGNGASHSSASSIGPLT